jgi:hypothetical protein
MIALLALLAKPVLIRLGWLLVCEAALFFVIHALGGSRAHISLVQGSLTAGIVLFVVLSWPFKHNLSWILALPYSKRALAAANYVLTWVLALTVLLSQAAMFFAVKYLLPTLEEAITMNRGVERIPTEWGGAGTMTLTTILMLLSSWHFMCLVSAFKPRKALDGRALRRQYLYAFASGGAFFVVAGSGALDFVTASGKANGRGISGRPPSSASSSARSWPGGACMTKERARWIAWRRLSPSWARSLDPTATRRW